MTRSSRKDDTAAKRLSKKASASGVPRYKHQMLASDILARIRSGEWPKGSRIPSIDTLVSMYPWSRMTIFHAVGNLIRQGVLETRRGAGTFVSREWAMGSVGLILGEEVMHPQQTPTAYLIYQGIRQFFERQNYNTKLYVEPQSLVKKRFPEGLRDDIRARRLCGLLSASCDAPLYIPDWLAAHHIQLPYVDCGGFDNVPHRVRMDMAATVDLGIELIARERRKVAAISTTSAFSDLFMRSVAEHGLETVPEWLVVSEAGAVDFEAQGFRLMHKIWQSAEKPDAMIVSDDIVAKGVAQAILQLRIEVPSELLVVTLANHKSGVFYPIPIRQIEFDLDELARLAGELMLEVMEDVDLPPRELLLQPTVVGKRK